MTQAWLIFSVTNERNNIVVPIMHVASRSPEVCQIIHLASIVVRMPSQKCGNQEGKNHFGSKHTYV